MATRKSWTNNMDLYFFPIGNEMCSYIQNELLKHGHYCIIFKLQYIDKIHSRLRINLLFLLLHKLFQETIVHLDVSKCSN